jgi:phosphate transport system substrate-binding protein
MSAASIAVGAGLTAMLFASSARSAQDAPPALPTLPEYRADASVSGRLVSAGSATTTALLEEIAAAFSRIHPGVTFDFSTGGSATAPPTLAAGRSQLAPMSRPMSAQEKADFEKVRGLPPLEFRIALDALGVFVHADNPVERLSQQQLRSIFGDMPLAETARVWGDVGVEAPEAWRTRPIVPLIPMPTQGSYGVMREDLLQGGRYRVDAVPAVVASELIQGVAADRDSIGFVSLFYKTPRVKLVAVEDKDGVPRLPTPQTCADGTYPYARYLYVYVAAKPGEIGPPALAEFLRFATSRPGQAIVAKEGFTPIPASIAAPQQKLVGEK